MIITHHDHHDHDHHHHSGGRAVLFPLSALLFLLALLGLKLSLSLSCTRLLRPLEQLLPAPFLLLFFCEAAGIGYQGQGV
eukprot:12510942-Prorocentrum_lima.AAC.1